MSAIATAIKVPIVYCHVCGRGFQGDAGFDSHYRQMHPQAAVVRYDCLGPMCPVRTSHPSGLCQYHGKRGDFA